MSQRKRIIALLVVALMLFQFAPGSLAEATLPTSTVTATVKASGTAIMTPDSYTVVLEAKDGAPLPDSAVGGKITLTRTSAGDLTFPTLSFSQVGVFAYKVYQIAGSHRSAVSYDDEVYTVTYYLTYGKDGSIVLSEIIEKKNGDKTDKVIFENVYAETSVTATKVWDDNDNQDGKRDDVTLKIEGMYQDASGETLPVPIPTDVDPFRDISADAVSAAERTVTWAGLSAYYKGFKVSYTVKEVGATSAGIIYMKDDAEYTVTITGNASEGFVVINSHEPEETEVTVKKVWNDANNQDGKRPDELTVTLQADGEDKQDVVLKAADEWTAKVENLPVYKDGKEIKYTWLEKNVPEYYQLDSNVTNGTETIITNTHKTDKTIATVKKVWDDNDNQDGKRPAELKVTLSEGTEVTLNEKNSWTATVENLPKYANGVEIKYTWSESGLPEGYELSGTSAEGTITTLTNKHVPEETEATVKKVWDDADNQDGKRPDELTVILSDGQSVTLNEKNNWTAKIEHLPKYRNGKEIEYTWTENATDNYTLTDTSVNGTLTTLTNKHTPEETEATVKKVWDDAEDQDGKRPVELKVILSNGTEVTLNEKNNWTAKVEHLPKYADGKEITYTWTESGLPEGYELTGNSADGTVTTLTNTHTPEETEATVKKVWDDAENQDGKRPDELKVKLSNGTEVTLNEANGWTAKVEHLPKYADGKEITYTWTESGLPEGYELTDTSADGTVTTLTNTHEIEKTKVEGAKTWSDSEDADEIRPASITIHLMVGETEIDKKTVTEADGWKWSFTDLDKYADGKEIEYTITEDKVDGYDQTISGYDVTNTHLLTRVRVEKELTEILRGDEVIADHSKAKAGDVITYTVRLTNIGEADLPTGAEVKDTMTRTLSDGSKTETVRTFASTKDLAPGEYEEFTYTYTVQDNDGYLSNAATTDIPGDPPPPPVEVPIVKTVTIVKAWKDRNNADKQRPESLTVTLLADGKPVQDVTLNEGNEWTAEVEDLMVLTEDGQPITYSWSEVEVEGYTLVSTTTEGNVTTMTNRQDDSPTPVMNVFLNIGECYE